METEKMTLENDGIAARRTHVRSAGVEPWKWVAGGAALAAVIGGVLYLLLAAPTVSTDDAFIEGHVIPVSAKISGHVARVLIDDNQVVKAGDVLAEIDPSDFQTRLDEARGKVASDRAEAAKTAADLKRAQALFARDEASKQDLEHAQAAADAATADLAQSDAALRQADLDLSYTKIVAPEPGLITRKAVEPGAYVSVGQAMLALVPEESWVVANFKETQLTKLRVGQTAEF